MSDEPGTRYYIGLTNGPRSHPGRRVVSRAHPQCWLGDHYVHDCHEPSGRTCLDCDEPAGTPWGPCWCPDCDVRRLDRISVGFADSNAAFIASEEES